MTDVKDYNRFRTFTQQLLSQLHGPIWRNCTQSLSHISTAYLSDRSAAHQPQPLVAGCAITPPLPTTRQLLYLEMSRDTSAKNEPRNTPIHVKELVIIYLEIHSPYISKAISRIFSWSIVKCFEPRKCFWDSVAEAA